MAPLKSKYRSHTCGELRAGSTGAVVSLSGWVMRKRDHGGIVFFDLRDHYGVTQIVFSENISEEAQKVKIESVVTVTGKVVNRGKGLINDKLPTGEIEVQATTLVVQSPADILPFALVDTETPPDALRLKYRFLDLRREELHENIVLRCKVISKIREEMGELGFLEFQTPILTASSPEGARDFLVPSRLHPGKFFALPQAPQQFKQLLMVSGFDRYFQIAPCFRDENPRADRSPGEFYQCDLEMSFVEQEEVLQAGEKMITNVFNNFSKKGPVNSPFIRIPYKEAVSKYGTDKPDLRVPYIIEDVTSVFEQTQFKVFQNALSQGDRIFAITVNLLNAESPSRKYFDDTIQWFKDNKGQGLCYFSFIKDEIKGNIIKNVSQNEVTALKAKLNITSDSLVFIACGKNSDTLPIMGKLRLKLGADFKAAEDAYKFCWVIDFPMYEWDEESKQITFSHNPFSMPQGGMDVLLKKDALDIYAYQYDVVCNGYELCSGAIRNHEPEIMYKAFEIAGYSNEEVDKKFGGMIRAFKFGAPPHGGMAFGIDRIVMLLSNETAIREVIAFPLAQSGEDLLMGAPSEVSDKQLKDVCIRVTTGTQTTV